RIVDPSKRKPPFTNANAGYVTPWIVPLPDPLGSPGKNAEMSTWLPVGHGPQPVLPGHLPAFVENMTSNSELIRWPITVASVRLNLSIVTTPLSVSGSA